MYSLNIILLSNNLHFYLLNEENKILKISEKKKLKFYNYKILMFFCLNLSLICYILLHFYIYRYLRKSYGNILLP